ALIAKVIAARIDRFFTSRRIQERLALIEAKERTSAPAIPVARIPYFCPGCPHNTSTRVPEGSRALAGIGCHFMVTWMDRNTATFSHMGGEGAAWLGQAPFTEEKHVFVNLGDGTYFHSGLLAIRAAVAAGVNVTYKLLYNDAVAMTGGQPVDGMLTVPQLARQLQAEGVGKIVVVTDGTPRSYADAELPGGVEMRLRADMDALQREFRELPGATAIIYDQTCAAEKRRRRKRGKMADPARRVFINEHVCEGCGDCGTASNCLAVVPVETEFGRKRAIDQSACNKDFSCLDGFCPSFVTVEGGRLRRGKALEEAVAPAAPPEPRLPATAAPFGILITGVGGTGVVTLGALIGTAAHIDGKGVTVLDMTGLAQKGGAVFSHVRICDDAEAIHAVRIATGEADAIIGGDAIVTCSPDALAKMQPGRSRAVVNCAETPTAEFTRNPDWQFPLARMQETLAAAVGDGALHCLDATALATRLLGDAIYANLFLLGYAWQLGLVPVSGAALDRAIELNGAAVEMNRKAFLWGRRAAHEPGFFERYGASAQPVAATPAEAMERRAEFLTAYQDAAYAERYRRLVEKVRATEAPLGSTRLTEAVAANYFKLLAIKDEYEVARLYAETDFLERIRDTFEGDYELHFHLAPPLIARPDPVTGRIRKREFGAWTLAAFRWLAKLRRLRGTALDPFARLPERRAERHLLTEYERDIDDLLAKLSPATLDAAVRLAALPERIRGFGPVKAKSMAEAARQRATLREALGISIFGDAGR
ncbi:MAG: indolepyruvate ferredoxin oxidoreductase family protein, partial [Ignavibacteria bacterium]